MNLPYFHLPEESSAADIQASGAWNIASAIDKLLKHIEEQDTKRGQIPKHVCDHIRTNQLYDFTLKSGVTHTGKIIKDDEGWLVIRKDDNSVCMIASRELTSIETSPQKTA